MKNILTVWVTCFVLTLAAFGRIKLEAKEAARPAALFDVSKFEFFARTSSRAFLLDFKNASANGNTVVFNGISGPYEFQNGDELYIDLVRSTMTKFWADCVKLTFIVVSYRSVVTGWKYKRRPQRDR